jgi:hypothetical protein
MGTKENLQNDYTIIVRPERGYNNIGSRPALQTILRGIYDTGAVNITSARGDKYKGNIHICSIDDIIDGVKEGHSIFAAYDSDENLEKFLRFVIDGDFGLSIVVQGLCENVEKILKRVGLKVHTINHSIGIWGKTERLPSNHILEITTMCGHGIVSPYLVENVIERLKNGEITSREGAIELSKPCVCGIFNTTRAENLLNEML